MFIFIYVEVVKVEEVILHGLVDAVQTVQQSQVEGGRSERGIPVENDTQHQVVTFTATTGVGCSA